MAGRPGKYAHLTGDLPRLNGVEPERRAVVEQLQAEILAPPDPDSDLAPAGPLSEYVEDADDVMSDVVALLKRATRGQQSSATLAHAYALARLVQDKVEEWRFTAQLLRDAYEGLMLAQMERDNLSSLRMVDGGSVSTHLEPYTQTKDPEATRQWCTSSAVVCFTCHLHEREHEHREDGSVVGVDGHRFVGGGGPDLERKMSLPWATLNALNKERLLAGEDLVPGTEVYAKPTVRLNKA